MIPLERLEQLERSISAGRALGQRRRLGWPDLAVVLIVGAALLTYLAPFLAPPDSPAQARNRDYEIYKREQQGREAEVAKRLREAADEINHAEPYRRE